MLHFQGRNALIQEQRSYAMAAETLCILLHQRATGGSEPIPYALLSSLQRKPLTLRHCHDAHDAMVELVLHHRGIRQGEAVRPVILLVVEPSRIPDVDALVESMTRHAPYAVCWVYEASHETRLRQYVKGERLADAASIPTTAHELKLTSDTTPVGGDEDERPPRESLTSEELEMLLTCEPTAVGDVRNSGATLGRD